MVTLISLLVFIAFYLLYSTSKKMAGVGVLGVEKWVVDHRSTFQYFSLALLIITLGLSIWFWGLGSGVFTFCILLMTLASLVVLLTPLRLVSYTSIAITLVFFLFCELILF
ncbi:hypothetical protein AB1A65_16955 [Muricauda sp. ANG21]|uniref:hypothetical protein n=1 Tax=Allomuricauda sp. ANG21 TaxID=3042468 RepID=UPI0034543468